MRIMQWLYHRKHRSGLKVPTDVSPYKPDRGDRLIGYSLKQRERMDRTGHAAGLTQVQIIGDMYDLWKLYDREQIVNRLDSLCPEHGYTKTSDKSQMLALWVQHEDICENPEILRKIRSYDPIRLGRNSGD